MSKFDGLFRKDSPGGRAALERLKTLKKNDIFEGELMHPFPAKVEWCCVEASATDWKLEGHFCGIPFYQVNVSATENSVAIKVKELE